MDKVSLVLVTALLVFILAVQKVELGSETLLYDDDVNENNEFASAWLDRADKTYYQDYDQDYVYYDEKVPSLYLPLKLLPLIVINIVLFLVLFVAAFATSTAVSGKRKRSVTPDNDCCETDITAYNDVLLDGPTWLSMVHELWEQDAALENTACTQETLCRMNRLAMAAPGQAGWAVSLSSLPLSYLLHTRHTGGFSSYMDAAMMGRSGANCTELYSSCPRLSY